MKSANTGAHVWLVLIKAYHAIAARASQSMRANGLGESDFRVLEVLLHKGPLPVNTIGPKVYLTAGSISVAVDRLYQRELVTRTDGKDDRRVRMVELTAKGRALICKAFRSHEADMERLMEPLSEAERLQLTELLKKIGRHAESLPDQW